MFGSTVFFVIMLLGYWFYYLREPVPSQDVSDDTVERVETRDGEPQRATSGDAAEEFSTHDDNLERSQPGDLKQDDSQKEPILQPDEVKERKKPLASREETMPTEKNTSAKSNSNNDKKSKKRQKKQTPSSSEKTSMSPDFNNTYPDSLQTILQSGNKTELVDFLNRLIKNVKYSSDNDVIVRSIFSQQTLRQGLANAEIHFNSDGESSQININQLIDKARSIRNEDYLIFVRESLKVNRNEVSGIEVRKIKTK
jgi:hypothetical protein